MMKLKLWLRTRQSSQGMRVQVHPGELWVTKQRVHLVLEASKSAGAKGDVPKICGFVQARCTRANAFPVYHKMGLNDF